MKNDSFAWKIIIKEIREISELPFDWDGYYSQAPNSKVVENALKASNLLAKLGLIPIKATPTSDESIVLRVLRPDRRSVTLEIDDTDVMGLELQLNNFNGYHYANISFDEIAYVAKPLENI